MRHKADPRSPESRVFVHSGYTFSGSHGQLGLLTQSSVNRRHIDAYLFKHPSAAHDAHQPTASI